MPLRIYSPQRPRSAIFLWRLLAATFKTHLENFGLRFTHVTVYLLCRRYVASVGNCVTSNCVRREVLLLALPTLSDCVNTVTVLAHCQTLCWPLEQLRTFCSINVHRFVYSCVVFTRELRYSFSNYYCYYYYYVYVIKVHTQIRTHID